MKKIILALATIALISSCSKQEITNSSLDASNAIGFNSYVNRITRAIDANLETIKPGFAVYGYYRTGDAAAFTPNFFNGSVVSYSNETGTWSYNNIQYWPLTGFIDFVAVGNNAGTFVADPTEGALVSYEGSSNPANQKDLLVATNEGTSKETHALNGVDLQFKHVLSRIDVKVKNTTGNSSLKLVVKSIKFTSIAPDGTYKVSTKTWTPSGVATTNTVGLAGGQVEQVGGAADYLNANTAAGALIIVPQEQTSIEVEYEYYQTAVDGVTLIRVADFTGANKKTIDLSGNWNTDTKYTYELAFGNLADMTAITFTAQVIDWTNSITVSSDL